MSDRLCHTSLVVIASGLAMAPGAVGCQSCFTRLNQRVHGARGSRGSVTSNIIYECLTSSLNVTLTEYMYQAVNKWQGYHIAVHSGSNGSGAPDGALAK